MLDLMLQLPDLNITHTQIHTLYHRQNVVTWYRVKVLCSTWHEIGHFRDFSQYLCLALKN